MGVGSGRRFSLLENYNAIQKKSSSIMLTSRYSKSLTPFEPFFQKKFKKLKIFYISL